MLHTSHSKTLREPEAEEEPVELAVDALELLPLAMAGDGVDEAEFRDGCCCWSVTLFGVLAFLCCKFSASPSSCLRRAIGFDRHWTTCKSNEALEFVSKFSQRSQRNVVKGGDETAFDAPVAFVALFVERFVGERVILAVLSWLRGFSAMPLSDEHEECSSEL